MMADSASSKYTKTNLSENNVNVKIDLEKLIGAAAKNEAVRETFFQLALDSLMERLDKGEGIKGNNLAKYSKAYKESLQYEAFGKDGTVNMQLTGDMVNDIAIKKQTAKMMEIGFGSDLSNKKAFAHMTGFQGHPTLEGKVKKRDWFGWQDKELEAIAKDLRPTLEQKDIITDEKILGLLERFVG